MDAPAPKSPQEFFLLNFLVNLSGSTVWKIVLFVKASSFYDNSVYRLRKQAKNIITMHTNSVK